MDERAEADRMEVERAAAAIGLDLPEVCIPGVIENRALLARHVALLRRFFAEDDVA